MRQSVRSDARSNDRCHRDDSLKMISPDDVNKSVKDGMTFMDNTSYDVKSPIIPATEASELASYSIPEPLQAIEDNFRK